MSRTNHSKKDKEKKKEVHIRVVGQRRREPDVRRIARAIIRLSMDADMAEGLLADLAAQEARLRRSHRANRVAHQNEEST